MQLARIKPQNLLTYLFLPSINGQDISFEKSIHAAAEWLLKSQSVCADGGYSHSFHFFYGWEKSYPETTGYIIPTLHKLGRLWNDSRYIQSSETALKYINSIQQQDGSFLDLNGDPQVFDVGQILIGLNYAADQKMNHYSLPVHKKAVDWLQNQQDETGAFVRNTYQGVPHSYYSRVGAALYKAGLLLNDSIAQGSGSKNIEWVLRQQNVDGFFLLSSFSPKEDASLSHTLNYVLEGLLDYYDLTKDPVVLNAVEKNMDRFLNAMGKDGLMKARYNSKFRCVDSSFCMTGLAQWAGNCLKLYELTNSSEYFNAAKNSLHFIKEKQFLKGQNTYGGIPGSEPHKAPYMKFSIPNWGQKFYIDSALKLMTLSQTMGKI